MLTKTAPMGSMFLCREGSCSRDRVNLGGIIFRLSTVFSLDGWLTKFLKYPTGFFQYGVGSDHILKKAGRGLGSGQEEVLKHSIGYFRAPNLL